MVAGQCATGPFKNYDSYEKKVYRIYYVHSAYKTISNTNVGANVIFYLLFYFVL